jgi:Tfp pilus assembly ATPase PilU
LRQAPNVILIGEVRDRETMQAAINFAETGHLCLTTLHANNTDQAFDRIINFFPEEKRAQVLMDLSFNVKAFISQRLLPREDQPGLIPAVEILLNTPLMAELIFQGRVKELKSVMARSSEQGIVTFDDALFDLYESSRISYETAIRHADSANNLRLRSSWKAAAAAALGQKTASSYRWGPAHDADACPVFSGARTAETLSALTQHARRWRDGFQHRALFDRIAFPVAPAVDRPRSACPAWRCRRGCRD